MQTSCLDIRAVVIAINKTENSEKYVHLCVFKGPLVFARCECDQSLQALSKPALPCALATSQVGVSTSMHAGQIAPPAN